MPAESRHPAARRAVLVPGHAVYTGTSPDHSVDPRHWVGTYPLYRGDHEVRLYVEHVAAGVAAVAADPQALLVFSGGQTRAEAGPISEAASYRRLAEQRGWFGESAVSARVVCEEYARDSFENVLFTLYRFHEVTARWPERVTVYGLAFKAERFRFHAETIGSTPDLGVPPFVFDYASINDPPAYVLEAPEGSIVGEGRALDAFHACPLGDAGELLAKRLRRDPFGRGNPYR